MRQNAATRSSLLSEVGERDAWYVGIFRAALRAVISVCFAIFDRCDSVLFSVAAK
jgi:hypothetical protein